MDSERNRPVVVSLLLFFCAIRFLQGAPVDWPQLKFTPVASGAAGPTSIADAGDGTGRLFVTEQRGRVLLVKTNGFVPFLDLADRVAYRPGSELGLLSVVFSPGFATNHTFYVYYNSTNETASTISRFLTSASDPDAGDPASEQIILRVESRPDVAFTLSGGLLLFGPDGMLYVGMGDSGFGGDPPNEAQDPQSLHGKILRIDVSGLGAGYQVPADNPFLGRPDYRPEIWAIGVRNPWRFSFDRGTGDFFMGDVGQIESEEINFKPVSVQTGQNYGWPIREGRHLYAGPEGTSEVLVDPIVEFLHAGPPSSVAGGYVYRGLASTRMRGLYFYADSYSGGIWALQHDGAAWVNQLVASAPFFITTFGEDQTGELYLADYISGALYHIEDSGTAAAPVFDPPGARSFLETITLTTLSPGSVIHYTTDGTDPTAADPGVASGEKVTISSGTTLKARTFRDDLAPSPVTEATYALATARPTFFPPQGPVADGQLIVISCATPGALIRITSDGTEPTSASDVYGGPFTYAAGLTVKARAFKAGFADSSPATFSPTIVRLENVGPHGTLNSIACESLAGRVYQVQVAEDIKVWRNFGRPQIGTGGTLAFDVSNIYPLPIRRLFRIKVVEDPSL